MAWNEIIACLLILLGTFVSMTSIIGIYRFPDTYTRVHVSGKLSVLGLMSFITGVVFLHPEWLGRLGLLAVIILVMSPVTGHVIAKAAYDANIPMVDSQLDENKQDTETS